MNILATYRTHRSVEDMNKSVNNHVSKHRFELNETDKQVLKSLSQHSLKFVGACHLKHETIANEVGKSVRTVQRSLKKLKDLHVIEIHSSTRKKGQQGANYYSILNFNDNGVLPSVEVEMSEPVTHVSAVMPTFEHVPHGAESFKSFNLSSNSFVSKTVVNNVIACEPTHNLKDTLRAIYKPSSVEGKRNFEELSKIAFGRLKQYMKSHSVPYLQLESIIIKAMQDLVNKPNVRNQFAMYSSMIKRQVEQLFEQPIRPNTSAYKPVNRGRVENVPDWFNDRNKPSTVVDKAVSNIDFETERQKILAKLG